jgi:hypothetical protein
MLLTPDWRIDCRDARAGQRVDFCFLVDATGSMSGWIRTVCGQFREIVTGAKSQFPQITLHAAVVAYRDYADGAVETLDFTSDYDQFTTFLDRYRAASTFASPAAGPGNTKICQRLGTNKSCCPGAAAPTHSSLEPASPKAE